MDPITKALGAWTDSDWVRQTFGSDVQDHYANLARIEIEAAGDRTLDDERARYFDGC